MSGLPRAIYDGTASCATCVLWQLRGPGGSPIDPDDTLYGTCHADLPRVAGMRTVVEWPPTKGTDWCGKYAPAGGQELARRGQERAPDSPAAVEGLLVPVSGDTTAAQLGPASASPGDE